ncbi:MAG: enoyl-CoA hydratase-related protein [Dehalococcoidia bacterium]|nr:enoyl-CoA hydratase-related protein [Dehalococcoidia bacterium]
MIIESVDNGFLNVCREDGIATVTVNRPESRNAMTPAMWRDMAPVMESLGKENEVRVIVLRGEGSGFVSGADIREFEGIAGNLDAARDHVRCVEGAMEAISEVRQPVIAMVNGHAIGGGCELAMACDLRYAIRGAKFGIPACRLGVVISFQNTQRLMQLVGPACAQEMLMTGNVIEADEAGRIGLVNGVFPAEALEEPVYGVARNMCRLAPLTIQVAKVHIRRALLGPPLSSPKEGTAFSINAYLSKDFKEGYTAFLEKRMPNFKGESVK